MSYSQLEYRRTVKGLCYKIYDNQNRSSKKRGHPEPAYSKEELMEWVIKQPNFKELYKNWVESDFDKWLVPSIDRKDNFIGYNFNNIRLTYWKENSDIARLDIINKNNSNKAKPVEQICLTTGNLIKTYPSLKDAALSLGCSKKQSSISYCISGKYKQSHGYKWRFK